MLEEDFRLAEWRRAHRTFELLRGQHIEMWLGVIAKMSKSVV